MSTSEQTAVKGGDAADLISLECYWQGEDRFDPSLAFGILEPFPRGYEHREGNRVKIKKRMGWGESKVVIF